MSRSLRNRLLIGLANPLHAGLEPVPIVVTLDGRGVVRRADGPIVDSSGCMASRDQSRTEAKAILEALESLAGSGHVQLETETWPNGRRRRVEALITDKGLDALNALRQRVLAAAGGD